MSGPQRVKIIQGYNPDLIGKEATVVGNVGGQLEVIVKGRESMRYTVPGNFCVSLDDPIPETPVEVKVEESKTTVSKGMLHDALKSFEKQLEYMSDRIKIIEDQLKIKE